PPRFTFFPYTTLFRSRQFAETAGIEGIGETLGRPDPHVMAAIGADIEIGHQIAMKHHLAAGRAFFPEIFRRVATAAILAADQALDRKSTRLNSSHQII